MICEQNWYSIVSCLPDRYVRVITRPLLIATLRRLLAIDERTRNRLNKTSIANLRGLLLKARYKERYYLGDKGALSKL